MEEKVTKKKSVKSTAQDARREMIAASIDHKILTHKMEGVIRMDDPRFNADERAELYRQHTKKLMDDTKKEIALQKHNAANLECKKGPVKYDSIPSRSSYYSSGPDSSMFYHADGTFNLEESRSAFGHGWNG